MEVLDFPLPGGFNMIRKIVCLLMALVLLPLCAAQARTSGWHIDENGLKLYFRNIDEWTLVSPDTVEEHMELCTSRGYTQQEVRERFASGRIVWEAYHPRLKDGFMRYEVWSDENTRNAWDLNMLPTAERNAWIHALDIYGTEEYSFVNPSYVSMGKEKHLLITGVTKNPPYRYESGYGALTVRNGLGLLYTYIQNKDRASQRNYFKTVFEFVGSQTNVTSMDHIFFMPEILPEAVDVFMDPDIVINAHTGENRFRGATEKDTRITAAWGGNSGEATADKDGNFTVSVPITMEGEMAVSLTAKKKGHSDNYTSVLSIPINDSMARLTLTEYPAYETEADSFTLSGMAAPGAAVFLTLNGDDPIMRIADADGKFSQKFEGLEDFVLNTLTVTANEEGLADATAAIVFYRGYGEDVKTGIAKFKAKTVSVSPAKLTANPLDSVGDFIRMEFRTKSLTREDGGITFRAESLSSSSSKRYPMILKVHGYLDDYIVDGMNLTVYGIVEAPTNDDKLPQIRVIYISYLKYVYH